MYLLTSSQHKLKEYKEFGIEARLGPNIQEVMGTIDEVITYKILGCGPFILLEDTVLEIDGREIVDSKFTLKTLGENDNASWITSLGYCDRTHIYVYRGLIKGKIIRPLIDLGSSFEPCFIPVGSDLTLYELKQKGIKGQYSARLLAIEAYLNNRPLYIKRISDVPSWNGEYQNTTSDQK